MIAELMGHVAISFQLERIHISPRKRIHIRSRSQMQASSQVEKQARTVFFTPLDPWRDVEEKFGDDLSQPRKVHCRTERTHAQNAVWTAVWGKYGVRLIASEECCPRKVRKLDTKDSQHQGKLQE